MMVLPETLIHDLRHGLRLIVRNGGSTVLTVLSLAIGIGANTAVYTAYKAMVARPLDARDPNRMVNLAARPQGGSPQASFSYPDFEALRRSMHTIDDLVAYRPAQLTFSDLGSTGASKRLPSSLGTTVGRLALLRDTSAGAAVYTSVAVVSSNYFRALGVSMLRGRDFEAIGPQELARTPAVLISENYWMKRFSGDPGIIGRTIFLNGEPVVIAGMTPRDFCGTSVGAPSFWVPADIEPLLHADDGWLLDRESPRYRLFGRLAGGATIEQAQAEASAALDSLRPLHDPRSNAAKPTAALVWPGSPFPLPLREYPGLRLTIALVMAAAAMVLAVACANAGSLQLARSRAREDELRIRLSIGATRLRIVRQLATESALLGLAAGAVAFPFTWALLKAAAVAFANAVPGEYGGLVFDLRPDLAVFVYVLAVSLLAGLAAGLAPALETSNAALKPASTGSTAPRRSRRMQDSLIAAQVSLSLVLMVAAAMAARSSIRAVAVDTGYETKQVIALSLQFPDMRSYDANRRQALVSALRARLETQPDVTAVTSARVPADAGLPTAAATLDPGDAGSSNRQDVVHYAFVQPNYFEMLSIPLLAGRTFAQRPERAIVVSETTAKRLWGAENPVGRTLRLGPTDGRARRLSELSADGLAYEVIGVARDTRAADFGSSVSARVYIPLPDDRAAGYTLLLRTRGSQPAETIGRLDAILTALDPNLVANCSTLEDMLQQTASFIIAGFAALVSSAIGLLGLMLAITGIYSTVSYIVVLRTREVGIRMAIGARAGDVLVLVLRESIRPVVAGLLAGTLIAGVLAHFGRGLLFGLDGVDPTSQTSMALVFLAVALLASYPPARRATRVDPISALRYQ